MNGLVEDFASLFLRKSIQLVQNACRAIGLYDAADGQSCPTDTADKPVTGRGGRNDVN